MSVESPELHLIDSRSLFHLFVCLLRFLFSDLFIPIQDKGMMHWKVISVVVPAKNPPFLCETNVVIDEEADLQESDADDENRIVSPFFESSSFAATLISQGIQCNVYRLHLTTSHLSLFQPLTGDKYILGW